jgi:hypothetical protein
MGGDNLNFTMSARPILKWSTTDVPPTKTRELWKTSTGLACPHGLEIFLVDGTHIRNKWDSDFVQGGNGFRYKFCPRRELWVDASTPETEVAFVAFHECHETELMRGGMSYEDAHDRAKRLENKFRRAARGQAAA